MTDLKTTFAGLSLRAKEAEMRRHRVDVMKSVILPLL